MSRGWRPLHQCQEPDGAGPRGGEACIQKNLERSFSVGLEHPAVISEPTQGLADGAVQGRGRVHGDARGPDAGLPAVEPAVHQCLPRSLHFGPLQIWGKAGHKPVMSSPA